MAVTVTVENGPKGKPVKLIIEVDLETPRPSTSGKTLVIGSTHGNMITTALFDGKPIIVGLNAYVKK